MSDELENKDEKTLTSEERSHYTILIVEDDVFVKDLYERTLKKRGYQVLVAEDGEIGLSTIHNKLEEIDLVLLDIMMPKKNGIEVLKDLGSEGLLEEKTVVLLTNLGQTSIIKEAFEIGAKGYMLKARLLPRQIADQVDKFFMTGEFESRDVDNL